MLKFIRFIAIVFSALLLFSLSIAQRAMAASPESDFIFDAATGSITGYTGPGGDVDIPPTIGGITVEAIGDHAFDALIYPNCYDITGVIIPDTVTIINYRAFFRCEAMSSITIPDSVTSIGVSVFCYCYSLESITMPDSVASIGEYAFFECNSLTSITIPNSVTSFGECTFYNCSLLTSFTIPDSVTSIGVAAFYDCSSLTSITIPDSVTEIHEFAFYNCSSLVSACFEGDAPPVWGSSVFDNTAPGFTIYFYSGHTGFTTPTFQGYPCVELFSVNIGSLSGGSISADTAYAAEGTTVNLTVTPNQGMQLKPGSLKYADATGEYAISGTSFDMPASAVTITAIFEAESTPQVPLIMILVCLLLLGAEAILYEKK